MSDNKKSKKDELKADQFIFDLFNSKPKASKEIEQAFLGSILLDSESINDIFDFVTSDMFFYNEHKVIFETILSLEKKKIGIDILTIVDELKRRNRIDEAGGIVYINNLTNQIGAATHILYHGRIIQEHFIERQIIQANAEILKKAQSGEFDTLELLDYTNKKILSINDSIKGNTQRGLTESLIEELDLLDKRIANQESGGTMLGVPTGFKKLDDILLGWQKSDLIIVAGRPSMGKTAATLNFARNAAVLGGIGVGIFSLEMSHSQIVLRLLSAESEVSSEKIRKGTTDKNELLKIHAGVERLASANIIIDDTPALTLLELKAKARRMKLQDNVQMIVIDYLQLMSGSGKKYDGNREQEISNISRGLKALAKELDMPIIALSQLSRQVESRAEKRPILSDLRESGAIEQDADIVMFLYRPEYYGLDRDVDGNDLRGKAEFIIQKHRNGSLGDVKVGFRGEYTKFYDLDKGLDSYVQPAPSVISQINNVGEYGGSTPF